MSNKKVFKVFTQIVVYIGLLLNNIKRQLISRMFWGRSNLYKNIAQGVMVIITIIFAFGGLMYRVSSTNVAQNLNVGTSISGTDDLLQQGSSVESVTLNNSGELGIASRKHVVQPGETLEQIAKE